MEEVENDLAWVWGLGRKLAGSFQKSLSANFQEAL